MARIGMALGIILTIAAAAGAAELVDHGPQGEFFQDTATGLFWFDPEVFLGRDRYTVDVFATCSRTWDWATSAEIDALVGGTAPEGLTLEDVMGADQIDVTGLRWLGFYAEADPDGWAVQADVPPYAELTVSGFQTGAADLAHGAWLMATSDPLLEPRLEDVGEAGEFFHDQHTGLYWQDPANFVGMTREEIETWLLANPGWRWATREEVQALVGMRSVGDVPLVEVLGEPQQIVTGPAPRWVGYYAQADQPNGMILQADRLPPYIFASSAGTQSFVEIRNPGAWIVTDDVAAPAAARSWGALKAEFR